MDTLIGTIGNNKQACPSVFSIPLKTHSHPLDVLSLSQHVPSNDDIFNVFACFL